MLEPITIDGRRMRFEPLQYTPNYCGYEVYDQSRLSPSGRGFGLYIGMVIEHAPSGKWDATWNMTRQDLDYYIYENIKEAVEELLSRRRN